MNGKLILGILIMALTALFIMQNAAAVSIHFLTWTLALNGALLFFIILVLGIVVGWLLHTFFAFRKKASKKSDR